ncbi:MAG: glycoside hydrolase family 130 protein [Planctomycetota bacterium]
MAGPGAGTGLAGLSYRSIQAEDAPPSLLRTGTLPMISVFQRSRSNPIITALDLPFPAAAVLNPGAAEHDGEIVLLLRVEDRAGYSSIYAARSHDGITDWRVHPEPILRYGEPGWRYETWGCEDARVTYLPGEKLWYIMYTAYSSTGPAVALARSQDLQHADRVGLVFSPNNKDAVLFPQRFDGRWAVLHRPDAGGIQHIWSAYSPDLLHWGEPHCVVPERGGAAWDSVKVGAGPPPIPTKHGWLLLYHGVKGYGGNFVYRTGVALLDRDSPYKVIARSRGWVFQAEAQYELSGYVPGVVFPTGALVRGDELWIYYGAADSYVCLAIAKLDDVLAVLDT